MEMKNAALIGLGAMGVFFAPRMEEHLGRENFCVIAGGERKKRLEEQGVTVNGKNYRFPVCEPENGEPKDLIIMAVKDMGFSQALQDIRRFVGERTLYSYMRVSIVMKDGKADFDPYWGKVHFGEARNEELTERVKAVEEVFERCDIPYEVDKDMVWGLWFKYMCNVGENLTCALLGIPFGAYGVSQAASSIRRAAMKEVQAVAEAKGIYISDEVMRGQDQTLLTIPYQNKPSTLQDLEAGRKTEIEMFAGSMVRMGQELGVPTSVCWMFLQGIHVLEEKNDGKI